MNQQWRVRTTLIQTPKMASGSQFNRNGWFTLSLASTNCSFKLSISPILRIGPAWAKPTRQTMVNKRIKVNFCIGLGV